MGASKLTDKQRLFVEHYLQTWNATEAARRSGYGGKKSTDATLRSIGSENLTKPNIREEIERRLSEVVMASDEVLARLSSMARGFDPSEYMQLRDVYARGKDGDVYLAGVVVDLDLEALRRDGHSHLIKSVRNTSAGPVFEFHDQMAALQLVGRHRKLFTDRGELSGPDGGPIPIDQTEWKKTRQERLREALGVLATADAGEMEDPQ